MEEGYSRGNIYPLIYDLFARNQVGPSPKRILLGLRLAD